MSDRISRSWQLVKASWGILSQDRELLLFPFLSMIGVIMAGILFAIPFFASGILQMVAERNEQPTGGVVLLNLILLFLFYFVTYTIIIFSNTAIVGAAMMRMRGENPTVSDGFRIASERLGKIFGYAAISATVGMILNSIRGSSRGSKNIAVAIAGAILGGLLEFAWNLVTFLVIPVLVVENIGVVDAMKRSVELLRKTWGEQIVGTFSIGLIFFFVALAVIVPGVLLIMVAAGLKSTFLVVLFVIALILALGLLGLISGAVNSIFRAALYSYVTTGSAGQFFNEDVLRGAFKAKNT